MKTLLRHRYLLIFCFSLLVHLPGMTSPFLDEQSYRQCQTALMAKNYFRHGMEFLKPEVYTVGNRVWAGTEFPIYSYLVACLYKLFGFHEWFARLVSALFAAWGALFLFAFVRRRLNEDVALIASLAMCVIPVHLFYTRTVQPEAMALWGYLGFLLTLDRGLAAEGKWWDYLLATLFGAIATTLKLPYLYLVGFSGALLVWDRKGLRGMLNFGSILAGTAILALTYAWYHYAKTAPVQVLPLTGNYHLKNLEPLLTWSFYKSQFVSRLPEVYATYSGLALGAFGATVLFRKGDRFWLWLWGATTVYLVLLGHYLTFSRYAGLPYAPIHGVLIGVGALELWRRTAERRNMRLLLLAAIIGMPIHGAARSAHWYKIEEGYLLRAREVVAKLSQPDDLFITQTALHPVVLYYIDRDGWPLTLDEAPIQRIDQHRAYGARFFFTPIRGRWANHPEWAPYVSQRAELIHRDPEFFIYKFRDQPSKTRIRDNYYPL